MDRSEIIQIARECMIPNPVLYVNELEQFAQRIRAAALLDGAESISKLPAAYNADYATVKVCASVLRNMAAAAEEQEGNP